MAALRSTLVLACRPGCEAMGMRAAGLGRGGLQHFEIATELSCALTRGLLGREFVPHAEILSFASPKESIQRKGDPTFAPSALRLRVTLRFSLETAAAELAQALQASTQTVLADYPVSSCDARRDQREPVRGGARHRATISCFFGEQPAALPTQASQAQLMASQWISPVGHAEHRRKLRRSRRGLFEQPPIGMMRVPQPPQLLRSAGNPQPQAKGVTSGSPSLGYLSWRDKKGTVPAGHPRHLNQPRASAQIHTTTQRHCRTPLQPTLVLPHKHACKPIPERLAGRYATEAGHA
jgi:hypothetical protein